MQVLRIQYLEVTVQELARERAVKGLAQIMILLEQSGADQGDLAIQGTGLARFESEVGSRCRLIIGAGRLNGLDFRLCSLFSGGGSGSNRTPGQQKTATKTEPEESGKET